MVTSTIRRKIKRPWQRTGIQLVLLKDPKEQEITKLVLPFARNPKQPMENAIRSKVFSTLALRHLRGQSHLGQQSCHGDTADATRKSHFLPLGSLAGRKLDDHHSTRRRNGEGKTANRLELGGIAPKRSRPSAIALGGIALP
jgi:hypothetical protein